jgi:AcrR family transcriptional regulator
MNETKARILDAAERLIAAHGTEVSLRAITSAAGVNLAAVNYHFQSKEALWAALVSRHFEPINVDRVRRLDALEAEFPNGDIPVEKLLDAFLGPPIDICNSAPEHFRPLMGRLFTLPDEYLRNMFEQHIAPIALRFSAAFERAIPGLTAQEARIRLVLSIGSLVNLLNWWKLVSPMVGPIGPQEIKQRVIAFTAAGFQAPVPRIEGGKR